MLSKIWKKVFESYLAPISCCKIILLCSKYFGFHIEYADQIPFIITRQYRVQAYNVSFVVLWQYWKVQQAAICQTFARLVLSVDRSWGVGKKWKSEIIIYDTRFRKSIKKYNSKVLFFFWYSFDKCLKNAFKSPKKSFVQ